MDRDIADRMRSENFEQFQTLVRMHLSFELDLNTDAVDNECGNSVKFRSKKLFAFPKKSKNLPSASAKGPPFNITQALSSVGIAQIKQMINFLVQPDSIIQEGIFRRTGSVARQNELRRRLNEQITLDFSDGVYTVHDCASVLKSIIADLPEPLLTDNFYVVHCQIAELCNSNAVEHNQTKEIRLLHSIQLLLLLLPLENRSLFHDIINMLNETTRYESSNKMSSESLATLFTPHLICPRKLTPEALHSISQNMSGLISFMIGKGKELQQIPLKLATDIRAYFLEQKRKKVLSPELQILDESVASDSTANTVYTFVDREKTAEAHVSNPTDTALAQLYAYIQTLPESSKKRKLIKQFNKENGQGTPLQQQMMMRLKKGNGSGQRPNKSISGSIKKHIFHTTLNSKTPKRISMTTSTPSILAASTPIRGENFGIKNNVQLIFQTPTQVRQNKDHKTVSNVSKSELESPKLSSASKKCKSSAVATDKIDGESGNDRANDVSGNTKPTTNIKLNENAKENYHTPISFNLNKFMICFKSEPDLSRVQNSKYENVPMLNRGRFIAKKLLGGVSMVNLRRPFAGANEKTTTITEATLTKSENETDGTSITKTTQNIGSEESESHPHVELPDCQINTQRSDNNKDDHIGDDDEDFVDDEEVDREYNESDDKENEFPSETSIKHKTVEYMLKVKPAPTTISCNGALLDSLASDSISPITKSTHRMSKAMQESIMTPRSRKPVIIGAMRDMTTDNYHNNFIGFEIGEENSINEDQLDMSPLNALLQRSKSESSLIVPSTSIESDAQHDITAQKTMVKAASSEALSTPFRQYLFSRSLMMATPVDLSFSSQSDDFENLDDSEMSESLIYCLNGNEPEYLPNISSEPLPSTTDQPNTPRVDSRQLVSSSNRSCQKSFSIKRPMNNDADMGSSLLGDPIYGDYSCTNAKKNHLELDETAL